MMGFCRLLTAAALVVACLPSAGSAQTRDIRASQLRLDSIRAERARLQREMDGLQSKVRDASRELVNISRQRSTSASALQELDFQLAVLTTSVEQKEFELTTTQQGLRDRKETLAERLRSVYKRGALHPVRVLLSAENFADLLNRYKYLHLITLYDRMVVEDVSRLERELSGQEHRLRESLTMLELTRSQKGDELSELRRVESQRQTVLRQYRQAETSTGARLDQAAKDEARLSDVITRLERERRAEEERARAAGAAPVTGSLSTKDLGSLNWPVDGQVVYRFGPDRKPNGITLTNNGIGISAAAGTPVKAVEGGRIAHAGPFEGYGAMVMIQHGAGYYTLYMFLKTVAVREGQTITGGQVVGTVGGEQTPEGPHLEFQVRAPLRGNIPEPVDPLDWLRARGTR
jgi:septal ring factor EnvC (AmiA/AmiB activator)